MAKKKSDPVKPKLDWSNCPLIESDPNVVSGAWVFKNTRVQVALVFMDLADNFSVDELASSRGLERKQVTDLLDYITASFEIEGLRPLSRRIP